MTKGTPAATPTKSVLSSQNTDFKVTGARAPNPDPKRAVVEATIVKAAEILESHCAAAAAADAEAKRDDFEEQEHQEHIETSTSTSTSTSVGAAAVSAPILGEQAQPTHESAKVPQAPAWVGRIPEMLVNMVWETIPALRERDPTRVEQTLPEENFSFSVSNDKYTFEFTDAGHEDSDEEGLGNLTGNWDQNFGSHYEHAWELLPFYVVTITQVDLKITVKARLARDTSQTDLANYLLDNNILPDHLDQ
jgi:hypothetical protein